LLGDREADVTTAVAAREASGSHRLTSFGRPCTRQRGP
jgi:hypothetical protein